MNSHFIFVPYLAFFLVGLFACQGAAFGSEADKVKWDKKFSKEDYAYGKEPLPFLKENVDLLKKGRALDIAAGEGRNAVFLAQQGFAVDALDISAVGLVKATSLAKVKGVEENLKTVEADLDTYLFPKDSYDTIIMVNFTDRKMTQQIVHALKDGGTFLYAARTLDFTRKRGKKFNPDYLWETNEVLRHFGEHFTVIKYEENPNDPQSRVFFIGIKKSGVK